MVGGFVAGSWYLYMVYNGLMDPWWGIDHIRFGIIGIAHPQSLSHCVCDLRLPILD